MIINNFERRDSVFMNISIEEGKTIFIIKDYIDVKGKIINCENRDIKYFNVFWFKSSNWLKEKFKTE